MHRFLVAASLSLASLASIAPLEAQPKSIYERQRAYNTTIHKVITEPHPHMALVMVSPNGQGKATLSDLVDSYESRNKKEVSAAINASFYGRQGTVGATIINHKPLQTRSYRRAQVGYRNRELSFGYNLERSQPSLEWLITAGPYLIQQGAVVAPESFWREQWSDTIYLRKNPRSAIGKRADGSVILLVTQGRRKHESGLTLTETARLMQSYGCIEAINLDGGGSAQIIYKNQTKNRPTDGHERPIPNAIVVTP